MPVLTDADRSAQWARAMRDMSDVREALGVNKPELRAALDAIDGWVEANAASFNAAIPLPARTALSAKQKARLLMLVLQRRFEVT